MAASDNPGSISGTGNNFSPLWSDPGPSFVLPTLSAAGHATPSRPKDMNEWS
jgi:hypothetical protein